MPQVILIYIPYCAQSACLFSIQFTCLSELNALIEVN